MSSIKFYNDQHRKPVTDIKIKPPQGDSPKAYSDAYGAAFIDPFGYQAFGDLGDLYSAGPAAFPFILSNPHQFTGPALSADEQKANAIAYYEQMIDQTQLEIKNLENLVEYFAQQKKKI